MKAELQRENADRQVMLDVLQMDLASFSSTRECVEAFKAKNLPLHLLINNAGVWTSERSMKYAHYLPTKHFFLSLCRRYL